MLHIIYIRKKLIISIYIYTHTHTCIYKHTCFSRDLVIIIHQYTVQCGPPFWYHLCKESMS